MKIISDNIKWIVMFIISLSMLAFTAFGYVNSNFVRKDSFTLVCERLTMIDGKLDRLIEKHLKE
jgi:uncharacterized membrane protein